MPSLPASLAPYVASVVAYDVDLGGPGVHRGLPSTSLTLVLPIGDRLDVGWHGIAGSRRSGWSSVAGLHAHPAAIHHGGHQSGVQFALTVAGARALFGLPASALAGELLEIGDVAPRLRDLPGRLHETAPEHRAALVARTLVAELAHHDARVRGPRWVGLWPG